MSERDRERERDGQRPSWQQPQQQSDKHSETGSGIRSPLEFRQSNSGHSTLPQPHELTAEWTVRAQLTFARAGEQVQREFSASDTVNPVRVVYKWSTVDPGAEGRDATSTVYNHKPPSSGIASGQSSPQKPSSMSRHASSHQHASSFHSSTSSANANYGGDDSAFGSLRTTKSSTQQPNSGREGPGSAYGTRCRSTCNIIVSAVADFLPPDAIGDPVGSDGNFANATSGADFIPPEEPDPFVFNTTASYTVLPEKTLTTFGRILAQRDAFSQTSDTETKFYEERQPWQTKMHDRPLISDSLFPQRQPSPYARDDGNSFLPSFLSSPPPPPSAAIPAPQTFKSASMPRIPSLAGQPQASLQTNKPSKVAPLSEALKKPRTVHIDVYCTGSEDDEQADNETSSSGSENGDERQQDLDSNSTPQTVLNNEQMFLRHQRITGSALPRRLAQGQQQSNIETSSSTKSNLNLGHALTKSSTAEEVTESKHLLFRKHIGDQRAAKLATLRQKYMRQPSDDGLSSTYPNSSRSTVRDNTASSLASTTPPLQGEQPERVEPTWPETDDVEPYSLTKSDSFDYEDSLDRLRIRQMERIWSRDQTDLAPRAFIPYPPHLQTISEGNSTRNSPFSTSTSFQRNDTLPSESENFSESDHMYGQTNLPAQPNYPGMPGASTAGSSVESPPYLQQTAYFPRSSPGFLQFFGPRSTPSPQQKTKPSTSPLIEFARMNYEPSPNRNLVDPSRHPSTPQPPMSRFSPPPQLPQRSGSEAPPNTRPDPPIARRFELVRQSPSVSETSTVLSGYTTEYLEKAKKFGKVVAMRKPGHHVGPTKNPNCSCESCQRWMVERFQLRNRAFSIGEMPILRRPK